MLYLDHDKDIESVIDLCSERNSYIALIMAGEQRGQAHLYMREADGGEFQIIAMISAPLMRLIARHARFYRDSRYPDRWRLTPPG
jgi:hypothetical protein